VKLNVEALEAAVLSPSLNDHMAEPFLGGCDVAFQFFVHRVGAVKFAELFLSLFCQAGDAEVKRHVAWLARLEGCFEVKNLILNLLIA
jgi:hypothetical protein